MNKYLLLMFLFLTITQNPKKTLAAPFSQNQPILQQLALVDEGSSMYCGGYIIYNANVGTTAYTFVLEQNIGDEWYPYDFLKQGTSSSMIIVEEGYFNPPRNYSYRLCFAATSPMVSASVGYSKAVNW